jgi:hypothetical protein
MFPKVTRGLEPVSYRGGLLSTLIHATVYAFTILVHIANCVYVFTQFAECTILVHIANKMGLEKKYYITK